MVHARVWTCVCVCVCNSQHSDYRSVMELYSRAAVTVNCRLHSGILSAAALRPTVYMASLPKFMDFMRSVDMDFYMVDPNRCVCHVCVCVWVWVWVWVCGCPLPAPRHKRGVLQP